MEMEEATPYPAIWVVTLPFLPTTFKIVTILVPPQVPMENATIHTPIMLMLVIWVMTLFGWKEAASVPRNAEDH